jgi:hypothetical protein
VIESHDIDFHLAVRHNLSLAPIMRFFLGATSLELDLPESRTVLVEHLDKLCTNYREMAFGGSWGLDQAIEVGGTEYSIWKGSERSAVARPKAYFGTVL